jgi:RimJ/RimL family protein N-acetyltransferase
VMLSVAMNLREHPGVRALAALLAEGAVGRILRASAWCGSWLPGWRADSDYRQSYSARAELGGGVLLDVAVHELDYLLWLAGPARSVSALARQVSELETNVEDVGLIVMELASGAVAEVAVDYFDRSYTRGCRIVGSSGTLHWSWEDERLTHHDAAGRSSRHVVPSDVAPAYRRQLERFLGAVADGVPPPVPAAQARQALAVLDAARVSSRAGRRVTLAPAVTLRAVDRGDADSLRAWRNDPETRHWSRSSHEIAPEEHASWFQRVLADPSTRLWMAQAGERSIGHVRVGPAAQGSAEVHVTLAPEARGRGLGAAVLIEAAAHALAEPRVKLLYASVKPKHEASLRTFARAGFHRAAADDDGLIRLERSPVGS